jgi:hypothetical protein
MTPETVHVILEHVTQQMRANRQEQLVSIVDDLALFRRLLMSHLVRMFPLGGNLICWETSETLELPARQCAKQMTFHRLERSDFVYSSADEMTIVLIELNWIGYSCQYEASRIHPIC